MAIEKTKVWGREKDIAFLEQTLLRKKSFTLLFGEPQIGKSTLIDELRTTFSDQHPSFRFGYHQGISPLQDPFTYAVSDLLAAVYLSDTYGNQVDLLFDRLKKKLTLKKFKEMCKAIWASVQEIPTIKPATKFITWLQNEVEEIDLSIKPTSLTAHEIGEILKFISSSCPDISLVLIIDDYHATCEMTNGKREYINLAGSLYYLLKKSIKNVHLIITIREEAESLPALKRLDSLFMQNSGVAYRLKPVEKASIKDWVEQEMQHILAIPEVKLIDLLNVIDGLPKVASELAQLTNVKTFEEIVAIANNIKSGSYAYLYEIIDDFTKFERDVLFLMTIVHKLPVDAMSLAEALDVDFHDVIVALKKAKVLNIVTHTYSDSYTFSHEVKKKILTNIIDDRYSATKYLVQGLKFYENKLATIFPHYLAIVYVQKPLEILNTLAKDDISYKDDANFYHDFILYCISEEEEKVKYLNNILISKSFNKKTAVLRMTVWRELLLLLIECKANEDEFTLKIGTLYAATTNIWMAQEQNGQSVKSFFNLMKLFAIYFSRNHNQEKLKLIYQQTYSANLHQINIDIIYEIVATYLNIAGGCNDTKLLESMIHKVKAISEEQVADAYIKKMYLQMLVNVIHHYELPEKLALGLAFKEIIKTVDEHLADPETAEAAIRGLYDSSVTFHCRQNFDKLEEIFTAAGRLEQKHHREAIVQKWYAALLLNYTRYFIEMEMPARAIESLKELRSIYYQSYAKKEIINYYAKAIGNMSIHAFYEEDIRSLQQYATDLRKLRKEQPSAIDVKTAIIYVNSGLVKLNISARKYTKEIMTNMEVLFLRSLEGLYPSEACDYLQIIYSLGDKLPNLIKLEGKILRVLSKYDNNLEINQFGAKILANMVAYCFASKGENKYDKTLEALKNISTKFNNQEIMSEYGRGLFIAWLAEKTSNNEIKSVRIAQIVSESGIDVKNTFYDFRNKLANL